MIINTAIASTSIFTPGLQNSGQVSAQALITGTLDVATMSETSNMTGSFLVPLPNARVISVMRVNLPSAHGYLASKWFPLVGTIELTDLVANWRLIMYVLSASNGRQISFNFVNLQTSGGTTNFSNWPINVYAHLYTYPW